MLKRVKIEKKYIGKGESVYIIAEAGSNHDGKLDQAKKLIDVASISHADAVKFQIFKADYLCSKNNPLYQDVKKMNFRDHG